MPSPEVVVLDVGNTSVKVVVFDAEGEILDARRLEGPPGAKLPAPAPVVAISPAASTPTTTGILRLAKAMPRRPHTSIWFRPTTRTRNCTSPGAGGRSRWAGTCGSDPPPSAFGEFDDLGEQAAQVCPLPIQAHGAGLGLRVYGDLQLLVAEDVQGVFADELEELAPSFVADRRFDLDYLGHIQVAVPSMDWNLEIDLSRQRLEQLRLQ